MKIHKIEEYINYFLFEKMFRDKKERYIFLLKLLKQNNLIM